MIKNDYSVNDETTTAVPLLYRNLMQACEYSSNLADQNQHFARARRNSA